MHQHWLRPYVRRNRNRLLVCFATHDVCVLQKTSAEDRVRPPTVMIRWRLRGIFAGRIEKKNLENLFLICCFALLLSGCINAWWKDVEQLKTVSVNITVKRSCDFYPPTCCWKNNDLLYFLCVPARFLETLQNHQKSMEAAVRNLVQARPASLQWRRIVKKYVDHTPAQLPV